MYFCAVMRWLPAQTVRTARRRKRRRWVVLKDMFSLKLVSFSLRRSLTCCVAGGRGGGAPSIGHSGGGKEEDYRPRLRRRVRGGRPAHHRVSSYSIWSTTHEYILGTFIYHTVATSQFKVQKY